MGNSKQQGPSGVTSASPCPDSGTNCRQTSYAPGIVDALNLLRGVFARAFARWDCATKYSASSLSLSAKGVGILKQVEELRLKPYDDQTHNEINAWTKGATIGYGHLILKNEWSTYNTGISEPDACKLFDRDLAPFVKAVRDQVSAKVNQNEFDALVLLTFNIGAQAFSESSVRRLVNDPTAKTNYTNLEAAWKAWNKSQGKVMKGLDNRRNSEWNIFSKGVYEGW